MTMVTGWKLPRVTSKIKCLEALWFWGIEVNPPICLAALQERALNNLKFETLFHLAVSKYVRRKVFAPSFFVTRPVVVIKQFGASPSKSNKKLLQNNEIICFTRHSSTLPGNLLTIPLNFLLSRKILPPPSDESSQLGVQSSRPKQRRIQRQSVPAFVGSAAKKNNRRLSFTLWGLRQWKQGEEKLQRYSARNISLRYLHTYLKPIKMEMAIQINKILVFSLNKNCIILIS